MTTPADKRTTSRIIWCIAIFAIIITLADTAAVLIPAWQAAKATKSPVELSGPTMGTRYSIKGWSNDATVKTDSLQADVDALLKQINQQMSTYLPDSELSRFNRAPADEWFPVSQETAFVVAEAIALNRRTTGASDVTVGPLVRLWDFGPGHGPLGGTLQPPTDVSLNKTRSRVGCQYLEVRNEPPALRKSIEKLEVDLSSIAKGYGVDAVAELLAAQGFENFMVEIGGEVRASGNRTDGTPWRIGVESPNSHQRSVHQVVQLQDQALATSGDYRNFRVIDGEKVSHIIDPSTGRPLPFRNWSVTVLSNTCLEADALATALLVMGERQGYDWCEERHVAALFLISAEDDIRAVATPRFLELTIDSTAESGR